MAFFASTAQRGRDDDERRSQFDQLGKRAAETLGLSLRPMDIDNDVLARGVSQLAQADHERVDEVLIGGSGAGLTRPMRDAGCLGCAPPSRAVMSKPSPTPAMNVRRSIIELTRWSREVPAYYASEQADWLPASGCVR